MPYRMIDIDAGRFANGAILQGLADGILGSDQHHIVNVSLVVSLPGASDQGWHSDGPHISFSQHLPCHVFNVFIPLVDVEKANGPTEFRPESHYYTIDLQKKFMLAAIKRELKPIQTPTLKRGSILLFDYRVLHRGTANLSDDHRPILVLTFGKKWYKDNLNFPSNSVYDPVIEAKLRLDDNKNDEEGVDKGVGKNKDVDKMYCGIWSQSQAKELEVSQLSTSGCGATAVMTVLRYLEPNRELNAQEVLSKSTLRTRMNDAPLPQYLASRSVAGCTGEEVVQAVRDLSPSYLSSSSSSPPSSSSSSSSTPSCFSTFYPACTGKDSSHLVSHELLFPDVDRDFLIDGQSDLIEWLADHLNKGHCLVATLNLQLLQNDAWHHQFIYGVDRNSRTVYCTNPLETYPEKLFKMFLCTPSVLLIRRDDIMARYKKNGDESVYSNYRWSELQVVSQIAKVIAGEKEFVMIPAAYSGGIAVFRKQSLGGGVLKVDQS